jgi:hypothetical protein
MVLRWEDPASALCRVDWRGVPSEHDPVLPYHTWQRWSFCGRCENQIYRESPFVSWLADESIIIEEWP